MRQAEMSQPRSWLRSVFRNAPSSIPLGYIGLASLAHNIDPQIAVASEFRAVLPSASPATFLTGLKRWTGGDAEVASGPVSH